MLKKISFLSLALFLMFNQLTAQTKSRESQIGLGLDGALPVGDFKDVADYAIGVSLLYQKPVADNLSITGNVGYLRFHGPDVFTNIKYKEGFVPIKAGARYFFGSKVYAAAELGVSISTASGSGSGTSFVYVPGLGTTWPVGKNGSLDIGLRYENWTRSGGTRSFAGIRAGYNF